MSFQATNAVRKHSKSAGSLRALLLTLADMVNEKNGFVCWPAVETLARELRMSERQVQRRLQQAVAMGELAIKPRTGRSYTNDYALALPGLPLPFGVGPFEKSDMPVEERVTSKATKGDISATQTIREPKKENQEHPLNPPKGEEVESDSDYWMKLLTEVKGIAVEHATAREWKALKKHGILPPREQGQALTRYLRAGPPERQDISTEANLLRCRKRKLSSLIRHLPEMCANAVRHDKLVHPEKYRPKPPPPPPIPPAPPGWIEIAMDLYVKGDDEWVKKYGERNREYLERTSWEELVKDDRNEILKEYQRREQEKTSVPADEKRS